MDDSKRQIRNPKYQNGIAPPGQEGWLRDQEKLREATLCRADGVVGQELIHHPGPSGHPSWPGGRCQFDTSGSGFESC